MVVELHDIQSIRYAVYDIKEQGITQIVGENSNGKSILIKACSFVANTLVKDKDERETIINDNANVGYIIMKRKGMTLKVTVSRERENCKYTLIRANGESINRSIREGGLELLAEEFGWVTFDGNVCLQIFETFGIMPFVNNREAGDYEIIDYIISDKIANNFLDNYANHTYVKFKEYVSTLKLKIEHSTRILKDIAFYDKEKYTDILYKLKRYERNIVKLSVFVPTKLPITKAFKYVKVKEYVPTRLPIYKVAPVIPRVESLYPVIKDFNEVANGKCPTCGVRLIDREGHTHDL